MSRQYEAELLRHAASLRNLARALVSDQHADDLLQDVALHALQRPPKCEGPMRGWLAGTARHLASRLRRAARRRARCEQLAAAPHVDASPAHLAGQREVIDRLHAAFRELPEPCRATMQLRYFEERTPREIAAATSVPLDTVKSRLKRGLALLRERLERDGGDWRAGLSAAFALRPAAVGAVAAMGTGVLVMASAGKLMGIAAAAAVLTATAWWLRSGEPGPPNAANTVEAAAAALAPGGADAAQPEAASAALANPQRALVQEPWPAPASIRGRCVDAGGAPLAGCIVLLQAQESHAGSPRGDYEYWVRHHYDPRWQDPPSVSTGADGRFAFALVPHEPLGFLLSLQREGLVAMSATWPARVQGGGIEPGAQLDLGDVPLLPGMRLCGRVVDDAGAPVAGARVAVQSSKSQQPSPCPQPQQLDTPTTDAHGVFAAAALPPGEYRFHVDAVQDYEACRPVRSELLEPAPWIELRVRRVHHPVSVRGIVVDERGLPIAGASVFSADLHAWSRDDGTFSLCAPEADAASPDCLDICQDGFEVMRLPGPFAWNTDGLRIVLQRNLDVELQVVDPEGRPVEDFAAWVWSDRDRRPGPWTSFGSEHRARTFGHHDGGRVLLHRLRRGAHRLYVEPRGAHLLPTEILRIDLADPPVPLRIQLPAAAERLLQIVDASGAPVADTLVELLEQAQGELLVGTKAYPIEVLASTHTQAGKALLRQQATTDARGEARLRGPAGGRFAVRCPGPRNLPALVDGVRLDDPAPLVVRVQRGCTLRIELQPAGIVAALRSYAGLDQEATAFGMEPKLRLVREDPADADGRVEVHEAELVDASPTTFAGVPAGTWQLRIASCVRGSPGYLSKTTIPLGTCTLREDEPAHLRFDLPQLLPAELHGTVLHNGMPLAKAHLWLRGTFGSESPWAWVVSTDEAGRFTARVRPGSYRLDEYGLLADEVVIVAAGAATTATFRLHSGTLRVRYVDADGQPIANVEAVLVDPLTGEQVEQLAYSDQQGNSTSTVSARQLLLFAQHGHDDDRPPDRLPLGEVLVREGLTTTVQRTLPADWLRR